MWTTMLQGSAWVLDGLAGLVWVLEFRVDRVYGFEVSGHSGA